MILTIFVADDQAQYRQSYCHQFETKKEFKWVNKHSINSFYCMKINKM